MKKGCVKHLVTLSLSTLIKADLATSPTTVQCTVKEKFEKERL